MSPVIRGIRETESISTQEYMNKPLAPAVLIVLAVYLLGMIGLSWFVSRRSRDGDDFLLGGRSLPLLLTLGTTLATMVGTGSSMGAVGKAYSQGWSAAFYGIGGAMGILLLALIFAPVRKLSFSTMGEELASYVGGSQNVQKIVSIFVVLSSVGWLGAHIVGGARYLEFMTRMHPQLCKSLIALGFGIYVIIGGYRAVVWTDSIQAILLFTGFLTTAILSIHLAGGWESIQNQAEDLSKINGNPPMMHSVSLILTIAVGIVGAPSFRQRIYSGASVSSIRRAFLFSGVLFLAFSVLPVTIGIAAFGANPGLDSADLAFPHMAIQVLPLWAGIIVIVSGISATLSSASSDAIAATGTILKDIHLAIFKRVPDPGAVIGYSRYALAGTILLALAMAMSANTIIGYIEKMIALFMSGLTMTALLGKLWPRFNATGAISTIVVAFFVALSFEWNAPWRMYWGNACVPSLVLSGCAGVVASILTRADAETAPD